MTEIALFGVGLSFMAILAGMFFNNRQFAELRLEIQSTKTELRTELRRELRTDFKTEFGTLRSEIKTRFEQVDARLDRIDLRLDRIDLRLDRMNADIIQFYHLTGELKGRLDTLETKR